MFIPRELGMHRCDKCHEALVDDNFQHCGIFLSGSDKWNVYFVYNCPHCKNVGSDIFWPDKDSWPGDMFRDFASALDEKYFKDNQIQPQSLEEFMQDTQ